MPRPFTKLFNAALFACILALAGAPSTHAEGLELGRGPTSGATVFPKSTILS
jgi:hypothetical protein